ncbi:hypothetical protein R3P38DRAFT_3205457 [Favolaschia claudopus]|uniref:Uncharacterized protein n=1 Tax=Favolaschia claudopus TaxID=2862362 RepID=A0AAW0ANG8_9AGAR
MSAPSAAVAVAAHQNGSPILPPVSEDKYSPDWPSELLSDDESDFEDQHLTYEDAMKPAGQSDVDDDSDVEVEEEEQMFSLAAEFLDDEVLLEKLLTQSARGGEDADDGMGCQAAEGA